MTASMRAYALEDFGEEPGLTEVPVPEPGPREVLVRVRASSVNPVDVATSSGAFRALYEYRFPAVQGRDVAGTVERVGPEVTAYRPGDEVLGMVKRDYIGDGTFAEFVVVPEDRFIVRRPAGLAVADAGALGLAGGTAMQCLDALGCRPGDTVLINGATGGVGAFAIQMAVARGLEVIATARPGEEDKHVRDLGAAATVDWSAGGVPAAVRSLRPDGVDGVIDLVSRDSASFLTMAGTATPAGTAVTTLGAAPAQTADGPATKNIHSEGDPALLRRLVDLVVAGQLRVPLVDVLPFGRIDDAFALLAAAPRGKVGLALAD